jgi:hypothetical protein
MSSSNASRDFRVMRGTPMRLPSAPRWFKTWLTRQRFKRLTRSYDREIAAARKAHAPVLPIMARKTAAVHAALGGAR